MFSPRHSFTTGLCAVVLFTAACASRGTAPVIEPQAAVNPPATLPATTAPAPQPASDPVADLIALSNRHFEAGQRELQLGHLEMAKGEFNRALEVLLESPFGGRSEPRIREHFDQLVERVSAYEITALAQGDGFVEKKLEPASIDELLAVSTFEPEPSPETRQAVVDDQAPHDIDIPLNAKVLSYVQLFSGRLKGYLEDGLSRGARYLPMIQDIFRAEGLPLDLAYVPLIESAFKPTALSRAKAAGIWQFMRGTALENGLKHDWYIDERAEPEKATRAAAKYLKTLHGMFDDWHLALASYNGGPGRVQRAMKRARKDDFWALTSTARFLPRETRDYVPLILAAVIVAKNPAQYGLNVQPAPVLPFELITLPGAADIRRIAEWAGVSVQSLQELNPELRRWTTPVRATDYELKVPEGTGELVKIKLAEAQPEELAPLNRHTVKKGETIATIARKLKVNRTDLAEANYLNVRAKVKVGQQLIIPRAPSLLLAARTDNPAPLAESRQAADAVTASNVEVPAPKSAAQSRTVYRVKKGDTLFSIARLFRTTVASIRSWNKIRGNAIQVGQRLTILRTVTATN